MKVTEKATPFLVLAETNRGFACYPHDHQFVADSMKQVPSYFRSAVMNRYNRIIRASGPEDANKFLSELACVGRDSPIDPQGTFASISDQARALARACKRSVREYANIDEAYCRAVVIAGNHGLTFHKGVTPNGAVKRICCEHWWAKRFKIFHRRLFEEFALKLYQISKFNQAYASNRAVEESKRQELRNAHLLAAMEAVSDLGDRVNLTELRERSLANPVNRRAELMARMSGFESYAISNQHVALFVTLTCPSRMHSVLSRSGAANPKYDQTTPREAHQYLNSVWRRIRAKWKRLYIDPYGMRIVEPQHDGTPHWHLMMFVDASRSDEAVEIFREHALRVDGNEGGASEHRVKVVPIDYEKGTATGYVAKYVCKNIDGVFNESDTSGLAGDDAAIRVGSWSKVWGIRQFQQFGGPPVSVWRELRRVDQESTEGVIGVAAKFADESDWEGYVETMGGIGTSRDLAPIKLEKVWSDKPGAYGDPSGEQTIGVTAGDDSVVTRSVSWTIERKAAP